MKPRNLFSLIIVAMIVAFAALNWDAVMMPTSLTTGFATFTAPLGLILLGALVVVAAVLFSYIVWLRVAARRISAEHAKKLEAQRELVDRAEASRFVQLREFLSAEIQAHREREKDAHDVILSRLARMAEKLEALNPVEAEPAPPTRFEPALADEG